MIDDLLDFNPNLPSNPNNNIFGLPSSEKDSRIVILPVPWEVTVSYHAGTARAAEHILRASMQVDVFDPDMKDVWKQGFFMREPDKKILMKSDYLRKEAELYMDYISKGEEVQKNTFICKSLREINEGGMMLNKWVYEQSKNLLNSGKLLGLLGGDHSVSLGYFKAMAEIHGDIGVLQIDSHCDLRASYEGLTYSHASIMYNALNEIPEIKRLVQIGIRDFSEEEWDYICNSNYRVITYLDRRIKERLYEGHTWAQIADEMINHLPQKIIISFDIDGLDPKLCPHSGTPVPGGFDAEQILYLLRKIVQSGRQIVGFDLTEVGVSDDDLDANVGAHMLLKLCNLLVASNA